MAMISGLARRAALRLACNDALSSSIMTRAKRSVPSLVTRTIATKAGDASASIPPAKATPADEIPSIFEQGTGLERVEIENPDIFKHNEVLRGPFGTLENPVKIPSHYDSRIVGCTGRPTPEDHDIVWLVAKKGEKSCCTSCNQYFELVSL